MAADILFAQGEIYSIDRLFVHTLTEAENSKNWCKIWVLPRAPDSPGLYEIGTFSAKEKKSEITLAVSASWIQAQFPKLRLGILLHAVF